ncbi:hypothetical protein [Nannocystis radixulma]|uniref:Lipoprotein n=1 Tax=Nannocystis radixulma TaxID=2995305 RepID=A0ABT5AWG9_9BACT|nr:hypothetical protein [Nannocystis radixulma]MDC0666185.1 hypothetical protein [Nannocystis radixulma]
MLRPLLAFFLLFGACSSPPRPLGEAILGEWEIWCRTDSEATTSCLGQENRGLYKRFSPGGALEIGARPGASKAGTWTLAGDDLLLSLAGGGMHLDEMYRARIVEDRLILWSASRGWGMVLGRTGAAFVSASTVRTSGGETSHAIGGVGYRITLPADYTLTRDDNNRQRWSPEGEGFVVELVLTPRAQTRVGDQFVTPPCNDYDYGGESSTRTEIAGVERTTSIGRSLCLAGSDQALSCSAEHTRGYLADDEKAAAAALCQTLATD